MSIRHAYVWKCMQVVLKYMANAKQHVLAAYTTGKFETESCKVIHRAVLYAATQCRQLLFI